MNINEVRAASKKLLEEMELHKEEMERNKRFAKPSWDFVEVSTSEFVDSGIDPWKLT